LGRFALAVSVAFLLLASAVVRAQGRFALQSEEVKDPSVPPVRLGVEFLSPQRERPAGLKVPPKGVSAQPLYYIAHVGGRDVLLVLYESKTPTLFVDIRGNGDLSDQKPYEAATVRRGSLFASQSARVFGPIALDVSSNGQKAQARFKVALLDMGRDTHYLRLFPAEMLSGRANLAGKSYSFALLDGNLNGRYNDVLALSPEPECDWLGIDLNGDGKFDERMFDSGEVMPLPRIMQVKDTYYSLKVEPDGASVTFERVEPELGTVDVGFPGAELTLLSDSGYHHIEGGQGKWQLPAGKYWAWRFVLNRTDDKRLHWKMESVANTGKLKDFEIRGGETLVLKAGPPLIAKLEVQQAPGAVSIGLAIVGQAGEQYSPAANRNGSQVATPALRILSESGKVLAAGSFQYG
jgi:hypothetical protein